MAEADLTVPVSQLDSAICDAVSKLELAVEREANVTRDEMRSVSRTLWQAMERDRQRRAEQLLAPDPGQARGDFTAFKRRLQILIELGERDLFEAKVLDGRMKGGAAALERFFESPVAFALALPPERFQALFALIQEREGTSS
jgi:hypothetical protein